MKKDIKFLGDLEKQLKNVSKRNKKKIISKYRNIIDSEKKEGKKISNIIKDLGTPKKVAEYEIEIIKNSTLFTKIKTIFNSIKKTIKEKKQEKKKKEIKETIRKEILPTKEEMLEEVTEIVTEKKVFESKKNRSIRITKKILGTVLLIIAVFIWFWLATIFIASLFAYLDGVKFYGLNILLFGTSLLGLWFVILIRNLTFEHKIYKKLNFISLIVILMITASGTALTINKISTIKTIKDVSEKYSMTRYYKAYQLPTEADKKLYVSFNSNYKTNYIVEYDSKLENEIKLEVKYYDCYYDFFIKQSTNYNLYVSLKTDSRDRLSVYIDDFKEGKVFDTDELERYTVKITMNKKDLERVVINN